VSVSGAAEYAVSPDPISVFKRRFWEQVAPRLAGPYDVLHFPYDSCVMWKRGRFVTTIHDVKPLIFGSGRRRRFNVNDLIERTLVRDRWSRVDHVLTDSLCSQRDIVERLGVSADRISVVYPGVEPERFHPVPVSGGEGERSVPMCSV